MRKLRFFNILRIPQHLINFFSYFCLNIRKCRQIIKCPLLYSFQLEKYIYFNYQQFTCSVIPSKQKGEPFINNCGFRVRVSTCQQQCQQILNFICISTKYKKKNTRNTNYIIPSANCSLLSFTASRILSSICLRSFHRF